MSIITVLAICFVESLRIASFSFFNFSANYSNSIHFTALALAASSTFKELLLIIIFIVCFVDSLLVPLP